MAFATSESIRLSVCPSRLNGSRYWNAFCTISCF